MPTQYDHALKGLTLALLAGLSDAGCASWCTEWTCDHEMCSTCIHGCNRPLRPPPLPPKPPRPPPPPYTPMSSIGKRQSDFWTQGSNLYTNAFGSATSDGREPLRIKGASWFGLESSPCYPGGASKGKIDLGMEFLRTHGFNALRLPLAVDAVVEAFRGQNPRCMAPDPGVFYTYNIEWMDLGYLDFIDRMISTAGNYGILVMLDLHAMEAGKWPDSGMVGEEGRQLLHEAWNALSERYCDPARYWNVFAADLKNEPHGMYWGPLGTAHSTAFPTFHFSSPPASPPPGFACIDDANFLDVDGDSCHAYELTPEDACGFPGYTETCSRCCATCRGMPHCLNTVYGDAPVAECKDDASFRNNEGHGCDIYRSPVNNALHCGAIGHEGSCQSCCFSCNGDAIAPMCEHGGAQLPTTPMAQQHVQDADYPWGERWDLLARELGNRVHQQCPRWLIVVEGVGHCMKEGEHGCDKPSASGQDISVSTWWGENLQAVDDYPVDLEFPQKVVYSPHSYGPSVYPQPYFEAANFPNNMPPIWDLQWGYLSKTGRAPILLGEWGGRYEGNDKIWQDKMAAYLKDDANQVAGNFYWCINPESGDTGGLLLSWPSHEGDSGKLLLLSAMPTTLVPATDERLQPPPPASPAPPPRPKPAPPPPPPPSPSPPIGLPHLAAAAVYPPSSASPGSVHRRHHSPPSSSRDAGDAGASDVAAEPAPRPPLSAAQIAKFVVAVFLFGVLCALGRRCRASLRSRWHAALPDDRYGVRPLSFHTEQGRAGAELPYRITKITKSRAMEHSKLVEISPQLVEPEPVLEDVDQHEREADEEESHVL